MEKTKLAMVIERRRRTLGLSQAEIARRLDVSEQEIAEWESGISSPDFSLVQQLATVLMVSLKEILGDKLGDVAQNLNLEVAATNFDADKYAAAVYLGPETADKGHVSPLLFGSNLEHTRGCIFQGLSAQMLRNRKFVSRPARSGQAQEWYAIGEKPLLCLAESYTRHHEVYHQKRWLECASQQMVNVYDETLCGIGQHELDVEAGKKYNLRIVAKVPQPVVLTAALTNRHGQCEYARAELALNGEDWTVYEADLVCIQDDAEADLRLTFTQKASITLGAVSLMPADHFRGMRRDVIKKMKETGISWLRWPGGNFAGDYNWMDGLLPVDQRAPIESNLGMVTQPYSMGYDFHEMNTDDFIALCRELGAEPSITLNIRWNTPEENAAWVEYCNGDTSTTYGRLRAQRGHAEPYGVKIWALGNEFGYGHMEGDNTPEGYSKIAKENARQLLAVSPDLQLCSSGPYPHSAWAQQSAYRLRDVASLVSQHYYSHSPTYPDAEHFKDEYYVCLAGVNHMKQQLYRNRAELPPEVRISMDEWNVWFAWCRPSSVTDGMFTALALHMLIEEAEKCGIELACHFEAINEGLISVTPRTAFLTAQGQVFTAMKHHAGGTICHSEPDVLVTLRNDLMTATVINASFDQSKSVTLYDLDQPENAVLYTSDAIVPPSFFHDQPVQFTRTDDSLSTVLPPHSFILLQWKA